MLTRNILSYYQSPDFATEYSLRALSDFEAAYSALRTIIDDLMAAGRAFLHPTSPSISLSEVVSEPLSINQLLTLAKRFASRLAKCLP
jgi:hypothetical protein